jgi:hypothetical protein
MVFLCSKTRGLALLSLSLLSASGFAFAASEAAAPPGETFAPPVRLKAGAKFMGDGRLYPSPAFHDVNGDEQLDVVIGDLPGILTVAVRKPGADRLAFEAETTVMDLDEKPLKFHNW